MGTPALRRRWTRTLMATTTMVAATLTTLVIGATPAQAATTAGVDVSHYQGSINWTSVRNAGIQWAYIKATEGTSYKDPMFNTNYPAAYYAGVIRGAYHFARPDASSGATQAGYFASNGGAWSADNLTLPGALDLEGGCYGKTQSAMRTWIADFINTYHSRTGRWAVLYTTTSWWTTCTGNYSGFAANNPLWIARWSSSVGTLPAGWPTWTCWQYTSSGSVSGISGAVDRDYFNGDRSRLLALANNTP
ncbi:GH25 family lysozyme [Catellatospora tritici]|uniref:GH25 family lysozyme n=1 Tax=Catellatospora tritici TaxID=2851566 RepID=UPI001C2D6B63|nr:GH25 family lysozyme [Catellatospora tritici]MBV1851343.1 hydrolase [Catellatospora tritici]